MNRMMVRTAGLAVAVAVLFVCTAVAQEYALQDYMPQTVGSTWTMKTAGGRGEGTSTVEVAKLMEVGDQQVPLTLTKSEDGTPTRGALELVTADKYTIFGGMFGQRGGQGGGELTTRMYDPPSEYPGKWTVGQSAEATQKMTRGDQEFEITTKIELAGLEDVTVPKGTFTDCLKLVYTRDFGRGQMTSTTWLAKGIGIVKTERPGRNGGPASTTELVDYEIAE